MTAVTVPNEWVMETHLPVRFTIKNSPGLLTKNNRDLLELGSQGPNARRFVVIDRHICQFYLPQVIEYFRAHDFSARLLHLGDPNRSECFVLFVEHFAVAL